MKMKETTKVFFSLFLLFVLLLSNQQALANELAIETPIVKIANSTLHIHDEVEAHKLLHKVPDTRKRKEMALSFRA